MKTKAISITMPEAMLEEAQMLAELENRTMSEFFRETLRRYIEAKSGWEELAAYGRLRAKKLKIKRSDVDRLIHQAREEERPASLAKK